MAKETTPIRRKTTVASFGVVTTVALFCALARSAQPRAGAAIGAGAAVAVGAGKKFEHALHAAKGVTIAGRCKDCHANAANGEPKPTGHETCMRSSCHVQDFLALNRDFCLGCHATTDNFRANPAVRVFKDAPRPGYYVEMSHARHMHREQRAEGAIRPVCWSCHEVDSTTFVAVASPGHLQCVSCHGADKAAGPRSNMHPTMSECEGCHLAGDPKTYFSGHRPESDVRKHFVHEVKAHRYTKKGEPLQCSGCHYMVAEIDTLKALKNRKIADERTMNVYCAKCHDVAKTEGNGCLLCHDRDIYSKLIPPSHRR